MEDWKRRLYDSYVSSGQAGNTFDENVDINIDDYPYLKQLIKRHLPSEKNLNILDLACGHGKLVFCLKRLGYQNVQGVDVSPQQVELAHKMGINEIKCQAFQAFLQDKQDAFDVIFMMDILEHLTKQELFECLDLVSNALKPNGMLVIHVPNAEGLYGMRIRYGDLTHESCFTAQSMQQALAACGIRHMQCYEDKPIVHGLKSLVRYIVWQGLTLPFRLLLAAETGTFSGILSQNMLVVAKK